MADRFFIAPFNENSGIKTNKRAWLIPDNAFDILNDAYVFRERVQKRPGTLWFSDNQFESRFRINVGTTDSSGNATGNVPAISGTPISTPAIGQAFSIGDELYTVNMLGTPAAMLITGNTTTATYNTTSGTYVFADAQADTDIYFYPDLPGMGLRTFENSSFENNFLVGFDTRFAYQYTTGWQRLNNEASTGAASWMGTDLNFFFTTTWTGIDASTKVFFVTNYNINDPLRYMIDGTNEWNFYTPQISASGPVFLFGARLVFVFKTRLVWFDTYEGATRDTALHYDNRARYSWIGDVLSADAYRQDLTIGTNSLDAATTEGIRGGEYKQDRLIIYFTRSTWEFAYTGNEAQPFTWQKINTELGAVSTFSVVPFDKVVLGIGTTGIHACSGTNVERIDLDIPNEVYELENSNGGTNRLYGIRNYFNETVMWSFVDFLSFPDYTYPNRVLLYNYRNNTWATFDDSITCFGYYQPANNIISFRQIPAQTRLVCAANQQGYTFIFDDDTTINAEVLQITDIIMVPDVSITLTVINHNLRPAIDYIYIDGCVWSSPGNTLNKKIFTIFDVIDDNTFTLDASSGDFTTDTYLGGGLISYVAQPDVQTKEFNFYVDQGRNVAIHKIDCQVTSTPAGRITANLFLSTSNVNIRDGSIATGAILGTAVLDTFPYIIDNAALGVRSPIEFERNASRLWHPVYLQGQGEFIQLQLVLNDEQMKNVDIRSADFQLHAICIHAMPSNNRLQ